MRNIDAIERALEAKKSEGQALLAATMTLAESEDRVFTDEERGALKTITDEAAALNDKLTRASGDQVMLAEFQRMTQPVANKRPGAAVLRRMTLGQQFVAAAEYNFFKQGGHRSASAWRSPSVELDPTRDPSHRLMAATLTEDPASGGALVVPQYIPGVLSILQRPLVVADLLASGSTDSNMVSYMQETAFTNNANAVAEGAAKPESVLTFTAVSEPVRKLAHWLPVTEEMLEDAPQIQSYIDARLSLGVQLEEDDELLNGTGIAPELLGLRLRAALATAVARGTDTNADAVFKQIMAIWSTAFLMPTGIAMNPTNWSSTALTKTTTGEYLAGGPFTGMPTPTLWGLPVAVTPAQPVGEGFVGAYKTGAQVFRKGGIRVEASNSHQDFFIKNLVAIRAEERLALAVYRPGAFGKVTGLT